MGPFLIIIYNYYFFFVLREVFQIQNESLHRNIYRLFSERSRLGGLCQPGEEVPQLRNGVMVARSASYEVPGGLNGRREFEAHNSYFFFRKIHSSFNERLLKEATIMKRIFGGILAIPVILIFSFWCVNFVSGLLAGDINLVTFLMEHKFIIGCALAFVVYKLLKK